MREERRKKWDKDVRDIEFERSLAGPSVKWGRRTPSPLPPHPSDPLSGGLRRALESTLEPSEPRGRWRRLFGVVGTRPRTGGSDPMERVGRLGR